MIRLCCVQTVTAHRPRPGLAHVPQGLHQIQLVGEGRGQDAGDGAACIHSYYYYYYYYYY